MGTGEDDLSAVLVELDSIANAAMTEAEREMRALPEPGSLVRGDIERRFALESAKGVRVWRLGGGLAAGTDSGGIEGVQLTGGCPADDPPSGVSGGDAAGGLPGAAWSGWRSEVDAVSRHSRDKRQWRDQNVPRQARPILPESMSAISVSVSSEGAAPISRRSASRKASYWRWAFWRLPVSA
jgi:hypothetical protein